MQKQIRGRLLFAHLEHTLCPLLVSCALLTGAAHCWARQADTGTAQIRPPDLVEALKHDVSGSQDGEVSLAVDLERIAKARDLQAIPVLEEIFDQRRKQAIGVKTLLAKIPPPHQPDDRYQANVLRWNNDLHIASVLVRLGVKDDLYWDYLVGQARTSLEIDIPFPLKTDAQEGPNPPESPNFLVWATSHNLDKGNLAMFELMVLPIAVINLAVTGDPRGAPLFREALVSTNPMFQIVGAEGLAELHDDDSVTLIIATCKKVSASQRKIIAESLPYFDDPQAQTYAALNLSKETYLALRQRIAQGHTPFN